MALRLEISPFGTALEVRDDSGDLVAVADCNDGKIYVPSDTPDTPAIGHFEVVDGWNAWEAQIFHVVALYRVGAAHVTPVKDGGSTELHAVPYGWDKV